MSFNNRLIYIGLLLVSTFLAGMSQQAFSQDTHKLLSPSVLPGNGLARFDFFYAGEGKSENMYIVRNGKIDWAYTHTGKGEISDAVMLSNKNILFAHQYGITEISPDKKIVWNYDTPEGCEIHTAQPIGKEHVLFLQNGNPAKLIVVNKMTGKIVKELVLPVGNPTGIHGHFRNARLTSKGTILVSHMDMGKVCEYDANGKELLSIDAPGVWSAQELKNGNILITTRKAIIELNRKKETIWEYTLTDIPDYDISSPQKAIRLLNGNTLINTWFNQWNGNGKVDINNQPVQAIEVTPEKKIVWALRSWSEPNDLGPSTTIIPLNESGVNENVHFGNIH